MEDMTQKNKRLYNIDFLRFVFSLMIAYYHLIGCMAETFPQSGTAVLLAKNASLIGIVSVLIFFILSGYFLCSSANRYNNTLEYVKKRCLRLWRSGSRLRLMIQLPLIMLFFVMCGITIYFIDQLVQKIITIRKR